MRYYSRSKDKVDYVMRKARIAIFDLDGSLVETDEANSAAYEYALARFDVHGVRGLQGRITAGTVREMGLCRVDIDTVIKAKGGIYCKELWRTRLGPAADALRRAILGRNAFGKIVLLTQSAERRALETLRYHGLVKCFDEIVCNCGRGNKYTNYFAAFDSDPAACVVWENEEGQVMSAIAAGVKQENIRKAG